VKKMMLDTRCGMGHEDTKAQRRDKWKILNNEQGMLNGDGEEV
jgi:hypothetical protein